MVFAEAPSMTISKPLVQVTLLVLGLMLLAPGCVVEPREGYYDRDRLRGE
jgi:hypothetical protein